MSGVSEVIDRLRRPEYTGDNRCLPCTAVNLSIATLLGVALGALWLPAAGAAAFVLSAVVIYLRGYLVPGTPTLTRRYMPVWVLELFGKRPEEGRPGAIDVPDEGAGVDAGTDEPPSEGDVGASDHPEAPDADEDAEPLVIENTTEFLVDAGIVRECDDADDLCLTDWFRDAWEERLLEFVDSEARQIDRLAGMLDADPEDLTIRDVGDSILVERGGDPIGNWISRASFAADMAAEAVLDERIEGWEKIHVRQRSDMLSPLRGFLRTCPLCGGEIDLEVVHYDDDDPESCCFSSEIYTARCDDCEERFVEMERTRTQDEGPYGVAP